MAGYGDDAGFTARMTALGRSLPDGAPSPAVLREIGSAYIDGTYGLRFPGVPIGVAQELAWPRAGAADYYGNSIASDAIPAAVVNASYEAAWIEATSPGSLAVVISDAERVKRLKAGSAEIEYADSSSSSAADASIPTSSIIEGMLAPFLVARNIPFALVV